MNRRDFLKAVGLALAAPGAVLGAVKAAPAIGVDPAVSGGDLTAIMIQEIVRKGLRDPPIAYYFFIHPRQHYALKVATARDEYEHGRWLIRHNRWLEKQGRPPIHYGKGDCGIWDSGVRTVETKRLDEQVDAAWARCTLKREVRPKRLTLKKKD